MVITSCSVNTALGQGTTLSAQFKDKMCLLNGECGGVIPMSIRFDEYDTIDEYGAMVTERPTISRIIRELVNHRGGEQLGRILISDIDEKIKAVMKWIGSIPVYLVNNEGNYILTTDKGNIPAGAGVQTFNYGDDVGFIYTDFSWPAAWGELANNPGDNVCAILDKIKNALGNYEYYYDVFGNFVWQEVKNYLNTTQATVDLENMNKQDYFIDIARGKSIYDFSDNKLAISFSDTPQYNRIKNDFVVWGVRENAKGVKIPIRYHLAIDKKPKTGNIYNVFFYYDPEDGLEKAKVPIVFEDKSRFPGQGAEGVFYMDKSTNTIYKWNANAKEYVFITGQNTETYDSKSSFPALGEEGIIYIDASSTKRYVWALNEGSDHYNEYQSIIASEDLVFKTKVKLHEKEIADLEEQKRSVEEELKSIEAKETLIKLKMRQYQDDMDDCDREISRLKAEIDELNDVARDATEQAAAAKVKADEYQAQADAETDPDKKYELQKKADEWRATQYRAQEAHQGALNLIDLDNSKIEAKLIEKQSLQDLYDEQYQLLLPYITQENQLKELIQELEDQIAALRQTIEELTIAYRARLEELRNEQREYLPATDAVIEQVKTTDWRSELYLQGAMAEPLGLADNYYYMELETEWPKLYDLRKNSYTDEQGNVIYTGGWRDEVLENPWDVDFMLDFIDTNTAVAAFSVSNIGRRSIVENKDTFNCVFEPEVPDFVIIESGQLDTEQKRLECEERDQRFIQVDSGVFEHLATGGTRNSCFTEIKNLLYDCTSYNNTVSMSLVPIYHLEPNTRITIQNKDSDIFGDFMINSMSIPLAINGNMNISATKVSTKL